MNDLGKVKFFLGLKIDYNKEKGKLEISQRSQIENVLKDYKMENSNAVGTPLNVGDNTTRDDKHEMNVPYKEVIGRLMYIMLGSRPDLCYAISYLSRFQDSPTKQNWSQVKRTLRYLSGTRDMVLNYETENEAETVEGYIDADYANDIDARRSISGYVVKVYGATVIWSSKKQQSVALSSTEAEYVALTQGIQDIIWLKGLLNDMNIDAGTVTVYEDNQGAIFMASNFENKRAKHIDVKYHFIREKCNSKEVKLKHISTEEQQADLMTKSLPKPRFNYLNQLIGLTSREGEVE